MSNFDRYLDLATVCDARGQHDLAADLRIAAARIVGLQPVPLYVERRRALREIA